MKIVLHVGFHKTGTTSFQNLLRDNTARLAEGDGARAHPLERAVLAHDPEVYDRDRITAQIAAAAASGIGTLIYSIEVLSLYHSDQMAVLARLFEGHETRLVAVIRHPAGYLPSRWIQSSKRRDTQSFQAFLRGFLDQADRRPDARPDLWVSRMRAAGFDDLRLVAFDTAVQTGRLLPEIALACGLPVLAREAAVTDHHANPSVPIHAVERVRLFNGARAKLEGGLPNPVDAMAIRPRPELHRRVYDMTRRCQAVLRARPALARALDAQLAARAQTITLGPERFAPLLERAAPFCAPYLTNPASGALFTAAAPRRLTVSATEIGDLPVRLVQRMQAALREAAEVATG